MKVYCYSGCGTCKKALKYLQEKGIGYQIIPIRETPPSLEELKVMLETYHGNVKKLFNTAGKDYRELGIKDKLSTMTPEEAMSLLNQHGNLVKRPFVTGEEINLVGFRLEEWDKFF